MGEQACELAVVMPVYNEEEIITTVLEDWSRALAGLGIDYRIHAYNDGSRDKSAPALDRAAARDPRIIAHHHPNAGHGPTILRGYRENSGARWLFQVDSDNEISPRYFASLWALRQDHDMVLGERTGRDNPAVRQLISAVASLSARLLCGAGIRDVNVPYRLMRSEVLRDDIARIPADTFAPNVIISALACQRRLRIACVPVPNAGRKTGTVSIRSFKLFKAAARSFAQLLSWRLMFAGKVRP